LDTIESNKLLVDAVMSETRRTIILSLINQKKHISQLSRELEKDRSTIAYHLDLLEKTGIVSSNYELIEDLHSTGKIGNYYNVNRETYNRAVRLAIEALSITNATSES